MSEAKIQDPFDEVSQRAAELAASDEGVTEESGAHPSVAHICEGFTDSPFYREIRRST